MKRKPRGTVALVSLGCAKNAVDLQLRAGRMVKEGWTLSSGRDRADVIIVNTCAFIASAREEAEAEICRALDLKRRGLVGRVVVTGCYPQRYPERAAAFPGVDEWSGVPQKWEEPRLPGLRLTGRAFAYLKIAEGCCHRCSYCAIPLIRGKYRSRPMDSILHEARALLKSGCRELNVIAQDPMRYGVDMGRAKSRGGSAPRLADLLWRLDKLPGKFWVRVLYSYPSEIDEDFLVWMMTARHAVRYIDVPIQHTVPAVLEKMNRACAVEASRSVAEIVREVVPDVTLRTTVMTGFPGETESRFGQMLADLRRMQFDHLGAFAYSPEEGTRGVKLRGRPSRAVALAREKAVMDQQSQIWRHKARRMVGNVYESLVVAPGVARMESQAPDVDGVVWIDGADATVGDFVKVRLDEVRGFDFEGTVVSP
jgi:ribosomal protein S12 methylthiotransferase